MVCILEGRDDGSCILYKLPGCDNKSVVRQSPFIRYRSLHLRLLEVWLDIAPLSLTSPDLLVLHVSIASIFE